MGFFLNQGDYVLGVEDLAANFFTQYFLSEFHNGYMINSLFVDIDAVNEAPNVKDKKEVLWYTDFFSQKKLVTIFDEKISPDDQEKLGDDLVSLKRYKLVSLSDLALTDITALTIAAMRLYPFHGHLFYYFPKFEIILCTHHDIGFDVIDVGNNRHKSHYFILNFLKQAGAMDHFTASIQTSFQDEAFPDNVDPSFRAKYTNTWWEEARLKPRAEPQWIVGATPGAFPTVDKKIVVADDGKILKTNKK